MIQLLILLLQPRVEEPNFDKCVYLFNTQQQDQFLKIGCDSNEVTTYMLKIKRGAY